MNKINHAFEHGKALIPFITCGDPSLDLTEQLVYAMEKAGADLIELGLPFSDPTAEGPTIQAANIRALSGGATTDLIFDAVERIRQNTQIPLVFVTYANVVFSYGTERFMQRAAALGVDGIILTDVPYEEKEEFEAVCHSYGIAFVSMIAPAADDRIRMIAKDASGFADCMPYAGAAGKAGENFMDAREMIRLVKEAADLPCAAVLEEPDRTQAAELAGIADGVIARSAIVKLCGQYGEHCVPYAASFVQEMKETICNLESSSENLT